MSGTRGWTGQWGGGGARVIVSQNPLLIKERNCCMGILGGICTVEKRISRENKLCCFWNFLRHLAS
jgi:hypothetical protein